MPKETVRDSVTADFRVEVSWGRADQCVQIATVTDNGAKRIAGMIGEVVTGGSFDQDALVKYLRQLPEFEQFTGWHVTITERQQINELIRQLRRARDHAFGRDE